MSKELVRSMIYSEYLEIDISCLNYLNCLTEALFNVACISYININGHAKCHQTYKINKILNCSNLKYILEMKTMKKRWYFCTGFYILYISDHLNSKKSKSTVLSAKSDRGVILCLKFSSKHYFAQFHLR